MIILGLGSNIGDRLGHLRKALALLKSTPTLNVQQVSPVYLSDALLPEHAPTSWNAPYLNLAIRCETDLAPLELLAQIKDIEKKAGRLPELDWGPRIIDIDILAWDDLIQYDEKLHIPHEELHQRPFALLPLADIAPFWMYPLPGPHQGKTAIELAAQWGTQAPLQIKQIQQRIDTPQLVGIVNITPDSFSDSGQFFTESAALQHVEQLILSGAEIIDLGAESTRPNAHAVDPEIEWQRLSPLLQTLCSLKSTFIVPPKISIDTRHACVAKKALESGADWINDVSGLEDETMRRVIAEQSCDVVFMHHLGIPFDKKNILPMKENPVFHVYQWAEKRLADLVRRGIDASRLIFDIGIGYGKTAEQSLALIKHIAHFNTLGVRLLVGHSRKSFLTPFTEKPASERDLETTVISLFLAKHNVDYLRVHNTHDHAQVFKVNNVFGPH